MNFLEFFSSFPEKLSIRKSMSQRRLNLDFTTITTRQPNICGIPLRQLTIHLSPEQLIVIVTGMPKLPTSYPFFKNFSMNGVLAAWPFSPTAR